MTNNRAGGLIARLSQRWRREPGTARATEKLLAIGDDIYDAAGSVVGRDVYERWAVEICGLWHGRDLDGFERLATAYREYALKRGGASERCFNFVAAKLELPPPGAQAPTDVATCCDKVRLLMSQIHGMNERTFIGEVPLLIEQWKAA